MLDAKTLFAAPAAGQQALPTFGLLFRGGQTAGTPLSFQIVRDCTLIRVMVGPSGVLVSTLKIIAGLLSSGTFHPRADIIVFTGAITNMNWIGRRPMKSGDYIWIDSVGGLGANDTVNFEFEGVV